LNGVDISKLTPDERWIISWLNETIVLVNNALEEFRFHLATHEIYELVWSSFCDWFIESAKVSLNQGGEVKQQTLAVMDFVLFKLLRLLHPFMPFVTEELAHHMGFLADDETIMYEEYPRTLEDKGIPNIMEGQPDVLDLVEAKFQLIRAGRNLRASYDIPPAKKIKYYIKAVDEKNAEFLQAEIEGLKRLLNAEQVDIGTEDFDSSQGDAPSMLVNAGTIYLPLNGVIDIEAELAKLDKQRQQLQGWIKGSKAKLSNEKFLSNAPENVVEDAKAHLVELEEKLTRTEEIIDSLK
jgi:valyl-tRNA synthetase